MTLSDDPWKRKVEDASAEIARKSRSKVKLVIAI